MNNEVKVLEVLYPEFKRLGYLYSGAKVLEELSSEVWLFEDVCDEFQEGLYSKVRLLQYMYSDAKVPEE